MQIGVQFPNESLVDDVGAIKEFAQAAEAAGYSHLLLFEHVLGAVHADREPPLLVPYDERTNFHEPMVLAGFLAAVTSTIGIATGVLVLPQRQTALVAKQAAEVAILSGDRLRLGVGVGHNHVEYAALGADFRTRGARQSEQIDLLRRLWTEPTVSFDGQWDALDRVAIAPRPGRTIPIWIGGFSEAAYRRAAKQADGFVHSLIGTDGADEDPAATVAHLRHLVADEGRDPSAFGVEVLVPFHLGVTEFARLAETMRDAGVDLLTLHLLPGEWATPADHVAALQQYMAAVDG